MQITPSCGIINYKEKRKGYTAWVIDEKATPHVTIITALCPVDTIIPGDGAQMLGMQMAALMTKVGIMHGVIIATRILSMDAVLGVFLAAIGLYPHG